jgi:predicted phage tail protein
MIIGGAIQMLSPQPKGSSAKDSPGNTPSYSFNGPINTEAQGHPVPYFAGGPMWIGSAVISAGISVEDHSHAALAPGSGSGSLGHGGDLYRPRTEVP